MLECTLTLSSRPSLPCHVNVLGGLVAVAAVKVLVLLIVDDVEVVLAVAVVDITQDVTARVDEVV